MNITMDANTALWMAEQATLDYHYTNGNPITCLGDAAKYFQYAAEHHSDTLTLLTAQTGLSHTYAYLADVDTALCVHHAKNAVHAAELAITYFQEASQELPRLQARIYDALGCALRQRYVYLADEDDCRRAIAAHRTSLSFTAPETPDSVKIAREYHLAIALYMVARSSGHGDNTGQHLSEISNIITKALGLNNTQHSIYHTLGSNLLILATLKWTAWAGGRPYQDPLRRTIHDAFGSNLHLHDDAQLGDTAFTIAGAEDILARAAVDDPEQPYHAQIAARLGLFSAFLWEVQHFDRAEDFSNRGEDLLNLILNESPGIGLRHASHLVDLLDTLLQLKVDLNLDVPNLIEEIGTRLDVMLPQSHFERPKLHFLMAKYLQAEESKLQASGFAKLATLISK
ncbi:hypothetical protein FRC10_001716 [Ceratobasidium sp. 414]|nr:hypothetical protein FRC10_001716 [Ceratobasidium sp. 414]